MPVRPRSRCRRGLGPGADVASVQVPTWPGTKGLTHLKPWFSSPISIDCDKQRRHSRHALKKRPRAEPLPRGADRGADLAESRRRCGHVAAQSWTGRSQVPAQMWTRRGTDVGRQEPSPGADVRKSPAQNRHQVSRALVVGRAQSRCICGRGAGRAHSRCRCGGGEPSPGADVEGRAESRCRCGRDEPSPYSYSDITAVSPVQAHVCASPGADSEAVSRVLLQTRRGEPSPRAHVATMRRPAAR